MRFRRTVWGGLVAAWVLAGATLAQNEPPTDLARDPEAAGFADLFFTQGLLKFSSGDAPGALQEFDRAAAAAPGDATYAFFRAITLIRLARTDEAIAAFQKALPPATGRVPEQAVRTELGLALLGKGDGNGAEQQLAAAIKLAPEDGRARFLHGVTLIRSGKPDEGLAEIQSGIALDPSLSSVGSYYQGVAALKAGRLDEAKELLSKAQLQGEGGSSRSLPGWLSAVDAAAGALYPPEYEIRVGLAYEHDDNPGQFSDPTIDVFDAVGQKHKDTRIVGTLRGTWQPLTGLRHRGIVLALTGQSYSSRHDRFEQFDAQGEGLNLSVGRFVAPAGYLNAPLGYVRAPQQQGGFGWLLQLGGSRFDLNGDKYRSDAEAAISLVFNEQEVGATQLDLHYDDQTFEDLFASTPPQSGLSGAALRARLSQYFQLGSDPTRWVRAYVGHVDYSPDLAQFDRADTEVGGELALPLGRRWTIVAGGQRTHTSYNDFFGLARSDDRRDLRASVSFSVTRWLYLSLRASLVEFKTSAPSLADDINYTRRIGSFGATFHW